MGRSNRCRNVLQSLNSSYDKLQITPSKLHSEDLKQFNENLVMFH